jgi:hypothetical protein
MGLDISNAPGLIPHQKKQALDTNYLSFNGGTGAGDSDTFAQQYLPELYEAEVERFGNRTLQGFLRMVGAEMPMTSDQVIWSEQNRLHVSYVTLEAGKECAIRLDQTIVVSDGLNTVKGIVTGVTAKSGLVPNTATVTVKTYKVADLVTGTGMSATDAVKVFVYGSEFNKGTSGFDAGSPGSGVKSIQPDFTQFSNKPIILKDMYQVSGSDAAQIGWVEVATEDGTSGYLWYLKAESETRLRFEDYLEMSMVEAEKKGAGAGLPAGIELDKQGAIEENMLFLSRATALDFDDMIAAQAGGGYASTVNASYGLFNNEEDMALNFGFSGFRRGSYDFYKTDWKYLNDASTRGLTGDIDGVMIPAGTSTVYDQMLGQNIRRPFLHVRYRASEADDRRMKSWVTGSVGGAYTSSLDAMQVHFLSERCLCVQGANNFVLFKSTI